MVIKQFHQSVIKKCRRALTLLDNNRRLTLIIGELQDMFREEDNTHEWCCLEALKSCRFTWRDRAGRAITDYTVYTLKYIESIHVLTLAQKEWEEKNYDK